MLSHCVPPNSCVASGTASFKMVSCGRNLLNEWCLSIICGEAWLAGKNGQLQSLLTFPSFFSTLFFHVFVDKVNFYACRNKFLFRPKNPEDLRDAKFYKKLYPAIVKQIEVG